MRVIQRICSILLLLVTFGASALYAQTYDKLWKQVEQAQKKSLPQTVIKLADEIYRKGRQEQNAPQMLKAYICRETYQEGLTPDSLYSSLKYMESWAQSERNLVNKAILHSLLAYEYADLMRKNRRVLLSRTLLTVDEVPEDIRVPPGKPIQSTEPILLSFSISPSSKEVAVLSSMTTFSKFCLASSIMAFSLSSSSR